uniref:Uncharacterized protein n=1 Tax=Lotus japonicus TaxID=34305 RepID=I3SYZ6_LOTJA|nr:unknown [Lotus japonicus]
MGPLGWQCSHLINYLEGINGVPKLKNDYDPATWMLEVTLQAQEAALGVNFDEIYTSISYPCHWKSIMENMIQMFGSKHCSLSKHYSSHVTLMLYLQVMEFLKSLEV